MMSNYERGTESVQGPAQQPGKKPETYEKSQRRVLALRNDKKRSPDSRSQEMRRKGSNTTSGTIRHFQYHGLVDRGKG